MEIKHKWYQGKYCGVRKRVLATCVPLKTKCPKRRPSGLHVWVKVEG